MLHLLTFCELYAIIYCWIPNNLQGGIMSMVFGFLLCLTGILTSFGILLIARIQHEIRMGLEENWKTVSRAEGIIRDIIFLSGVAAMYFGGDLLLGAI